MKYFLPFSVLLLLVANSSLQGQNIGDFNSVGPGFQDALFNIPSTHTFQYIIEQDDALSEGGTMPDNLDFM